MTLTIEQIEEFLKRNPEFKASCVVAYRDEKGMITTNFDDFELIAESRTLIVSLLKKYKAEREKVKVAVECLKHYSQDQTRVMKDIWSKDNNLRQQLVYLYDSEPAKEALAKMGVKP